MKYEFNSDGSINLPKPSIYNEDWFEFGKKSVKERKEAKPGVRYFLFITHPDNYRICIEKGLWGVEGNKRNEILKTRKGDQAIFYLKTPDKSFGIVCEITSDVFYDETELWPNGTYPHRIKFEPIFSSDSPLEIDQNLIDAVDLFRRKDNRWGGVLQTSMVQIPEKDFLTIYERLKGE